MKPLHLPLSVLLLASSAAAQIPVQYVTDATNDNVWRCADLNADGDLNDPGEVVVFYSDVLGSIVLGNNVGLHAGPDATVYVTDSTEDCVLAFRDFNGDGNANSDGEHWRFFDGRAGGNASAVLMPAANGLYFDRNTGVWWVASSNSGSTGNDAILRLVDLNGDGDANDAGEASEFWTFPGSPGGDSLPQAVTVGLDGAVYFMDAPSSGLRQKGVYRLQDLNSDGDAMDVGEETLFFVPPFTATPFYWCLELGPDGWFYTADTGNEIVWRFRDLNSNGVIGAGEFSAFYTVGSASTMWDLTVAPDGSVYVSDFAPTSRIIRLLDGDASGVIGPGEATVVYDEALSPSVIGNGRGIDLERELSAGVAYCYGDGTGNACPCGNVGTAGKGCANSIFASGARLETQGAASIANDTLALVGTRMPNSSALYFQGTTTAGGGPGVVFGDGLRCVGGSVIRLGTKSNVAGLSRYPAPGDQPVSVRGQNAAGNVRYYQVWYRNAAAFCTPDTFNLSNGVELTWAP
ncbi:MAG: hypothetical protein JNK02_08975 [Planctomycetes bacterium]|nr:hypothetical protein [Planctomycetota bacterium]